MHRPAAFVIAALALACQENPALVLAAGGQHTCALDASGSVWCWGDNAAGQLGNGAIWTRPTLVATRVVGLGSALHVSLGRAHSCALSPDAVSCWGANGRGQLGDGSLATKPSPVALPLVAERLSAGAFHTCALAAAEVWCWGANDAGQVGDGTTADAAKPVRVELPGPARDVAAGSAHSCAIVGAERALWCWGDGTRGQLLGATASLTPMDLGLRDVEALSLEKSGDPLGARTRTPGATCVSTDDEVLCWGGTNDFGQLGELSSVGLTSPLVEPRPEPFGALLSLGGRHACAVAKDGRLFCRGFWANVGLAQVASGIVPKLQPVNGEANAAFGGFAPVNVVAGAAHACAATEGGHVFCWGDGAFGQVGASSGSLTPVCVRGFCPDEKPAPIAPEADVPASVPLVRQVETDGLHTCALRDDGSVACWGHDPYAASSEGLTYRTPRIVPVGVAATLALKAGRLAVVVGGEVFAGPVGDELAKVPGLSRVVSVTLEAEHGCAIDEAHVAQCWGAREDRVEGVLAIAGDCTLDLEGLVACGGSEVTLPEPAIDLSDHCAVLASGKVACWSAALEVVEIAGVSGASRVFVTGDTACALAGGVVTCWEGDVPALEGVAALSLGGEPPFVAGCATRTNGTFACWGRATRGNLGDGRDDVVSDAPVEPLCYWNPALSACGDGSLLHRISFEGERVEPATVTLVLESDAELAFDCEGDGTFAPEATCTFDDSGTWTVRVRAVLGDREETIPVLVEVENVAPAIASVVADPPAMPEGSSGAVVVSAETFDVPGDPMTFEWDCDGDGAFEKSDEATTSCAFDAFPGAPVTISVRATDDEGASTVGTVEVGSQNLAPVVAGVTTTPALPLPRGFSGPVSFEVDAADPGGDALSYAIECQFGFGFGPQQPTPTLSCTYAGLTGPVDPRIRVRDAEGAETLHEVRLPVGVAIVGATADGPYCGSIDAAVVSIDARNALTFDFDCDGDGTWDATQAESSFTCTYATPLLEDATVLVRANDEGGSDASSVTLVVDEECTPP